MLLFEQIGEGEKQGGTGSEAGTMRGHKLIGLIVTAVVEVGMEAEAEAEAEGGGCTARFSLP